MTERCDLQDHIVPYMLDERHVEDTLFIVVEEDFRFFDEGQGEPIAPEPKLKASQAFLQSALEPAVAARLQVGVPGYHTKSAASSNSGPLDEAYQQHPQKQCHQRPHMVGLVCPTRSGPCGGTPHSEGVVALADARRAEP